MVDVTAPHAFCKGLPYRSCDTLAGEASSELSRALVSRGISSHRFAAQTPRADCDLNRDACYDHPWRLEVREHVASDEGVRRLLDVHSYPADYPEWSPYEIVVLDDYTGGYRAFASGLYEHLRRGGARVLFAQGVNNSIQDEFNSRGIPSTLIEFREDLDRSRLSQLCSVIADYAVGGMDHQKQKGTNLWTLYRSDHTQGFR